jgi:hypothetical protein
MQVLVDALLGAAPAGSAPSGEGGADAFAVAASMADASAVALATAAGMPSITSQARA